VIPLISYYLRKIDKVIEFIILIYIYIYIYISHTHTHTHTHIDLTPSIVSFNHMCNKKARVMEPLHESVSRQIQKKITNMHSKLIRTEKRLFLNQMIVFGKCEGEGVCGCVYYLRVWERFSFYTYLAFYRWFKFGWTSSFSLWLLKPKLNQTKFVFLGGRGCLILFSSIWFFWLILFLFS